MFGLAIYFAASRCVSDRELLLWSRVTAVALGIVSALGVAQYVGVASTLIPSAGLPSSTFFYRNFAAMYLVLALPLAAVPFLIAPDTRRTALWSTPLTLGALLLVYTRTRGAWVGFGLAILLVSIAVTIGSESPGHFLRRARALLSGKKALIIFAGALILTAGSMVPQDIGSGLLTGVAIPSQKRGVLDAAWSIAQGQHSGRLPVWRNSMDIVRDYPVVGLGLANWELYYPAYSRGEQFRPGFAFLRPHNDYLWILTELGIIGLGIHLWLLVLAVWLACRYCLDEGSRVRNLVLIAAALGILGISGHAFFSFPRERPTPTALTWLYLGLVAGAVSRRRAESGAGGEPGFGRVAGALPATLLVVLTVWGGVHVFRGYRADAAYFQGILARANGEWEEAASHMDRAAAIGVFDYRYLLHKSQVAQHLGRLDDALAASQSCLEYHPNSISAWYNVGQLRSSLGDYNGARDALTRTVQLDPDNGSAYGHLGVVYRRLGMPDSARASYAHALAYSPRDAVIHSNAGALYREQGEVLRARELYALSTDLDPDFAPAHRGLAEALGELGEYEAAAEAYREAIRLDPGPADAHYGLGLMLEKLGDRDGAARSYREFLGRWRGSPEIARKIRGYLERME